MQISLIVPDEWGEKLDKLAKQDGHSNRAAVVRKIINLFFDRKSHFVAIGADQTEPQK